MNIYLDIDGVLITKDGVPAEHLSDFVKYILRNHSVYWLTTHCRAGGNNAVNYLKDKIDQKSFKLIKKIKPTNWNTLKTEAIDFKKDFLWIDDYIMEAEKNILKMNNCTDKIMLIDLRKNPNQLLKILNNKNLWK